MVIDQLELDLTIGCARIVCVIAFENRYGVASERDKQKRSGFELEIS